MVEALKLKVLKELVHYLLYYGLDLITLVSRSPGINIDYYLLELLVIRKVPYYKFVVLLLVLGLALHLKKKEDKQFDVHQAVKLVKVCYNLTGEQEVVLLLSHGIVDQVREEASNWVVRAFTEAEDLLQAVLMN